MTASTKIEPLYVVDTNALFWYLTTDKQLSRQAMMIFEAAEGGETLLIVSAIVLSELFYVDKKWNVFQDFSKIFSDIKSKPYFRLVPFNADDVLDFDRDSAIPEMHDRIIAGLARRLGAPLLTVDPEIATAGIVDVVW